MIESFEKLVTLGFPSFFYLPFTSTTKNGHEHK